MVLQGRKNTSPELTIGPGGHPQTKVVAACQPSCASRPLDEVSKPERETDHWENRNCITERTEAQAEQEEQESGELTKEVPGNGCNNKRILAVPLTVAVMILMIISVSLRFIVIEHHRRKVRGRT